MYITLLGILSGVLIRSIVPFLIKLKKNPRVKWNNKYLVSAFAGLILSSILAFIIFVQIGSELDFGTSFLMGFTLHSLSREMHKLFEA